MSGKSGKFFALEGIDGSGKSTQVKLLAQKLIDLGYKVHSTCEPTDGPIGKMIRQIFSGKLPADQRTIAALFAADRLEHILNKENGMLKLLEEGYIVLSDRYYFSSFAYHSVHVDMDWVIAANAEAIKLLKPTASIFIDVSPQMSMERISKSRTDLEMYETEGNLIKVRENYQVAFNKLQESETIVKVDGNKSLSEVSQQLLETVLSFLK